MDFIRNQLALHPFRSGLVVAGVAVAATWFLTSGTT